MIYRASKFPKFIVKIFEFESQILDKFFLDCKLKKDTIQALF